MVWLPTKESSEHAAAGLVSAVVAVYHLWRRERAMQIPKWEPPPDWLRITTIDAHTEGEPFRVITSGFPELPGDTILQRRRYAKEHFDHLRTALMWEPRGHADMYGCIVTPPVSPEADLGI